MSLRLCRNPLVRAVIVGFVATALLLVPARATAAGSRTVPPWCGAAIYKADGSKWQCTFDDEFGGSSLDTTKWTAWNNVNFFAQQSTCYYSDPQHVAVQNGHLTLSVTRVTAPPPCQTAVGTFTPTYGAGVVHTKDHFSQTYGRFEARIKFAGGMGLHDDFWLYPVNKLYPGRAEIDVAEPYGALPDTVHAVTHMTGLDGNDHGGMGQCTVTAWASAYHTYAVEWTPTAITFTYDGQTCYTYSNWTPLSGFAAPAPFNQNFFMILQAGLDDGSYSPAPDSTTVFPASMQVDYVRVWK